MAFKDEYKEVGAIWVRETRAGREMLSIIINGQEFIAFPVEKRPKDTFPHYRIYRKKTELEHKAEEQEYKLNNQINLPDEIPF